MLLLLLLLTGGCGGRVRGCPHPHPLGAGVTLCLPPGTELLHDAEAQGWGFTTATPQGLAVRAAWIRPGAPCQDPPPKLRLDRTASALLPLRLGPDLCPGEGLPGPRVVLPLGGLRAERYTVWQEGLWVRAVAPLSGNRTLYLMARGPGVRPDDPQDWVMRSERGQEPRP